MKVLTVLFTLWGTVVWCKEIGDACAAGADPGVCKLIDDCPYAVQLVVEEEKKPPMCRWEGSTRIVCCPLPKQPTRNDEGGFRINIPDESVQPPEPDGCPPLPPPKYNRSDIPWTKCLENQRYVKICVESSSDRKTYYRQDTCDMTHTADRIVGGIPALRKEFPHMALLGCWENNINNKNIQWVGGGTVISEKFILTAAHVLSHQDHGPVRQALVGVTNKTQAQDVNMFNILKRLPHESYKRNEKYFDIALLELDKRIVFSEFVRPACLPISGLEISGEKIIAGWGQTGTDDPQSEILLKTNVQEYDFATQCSKQLDLQNFIWNNDSMICAAGEKGQPFDSCQGDSGGPLMAYIDAISCSYIVRGLVSWGSKCGRGAGVYTNVEFYLDWIIGYVWPKID